MTEISTLHIPQKGDKDYHFWVGKLEDAPTFALSSNLRRHTFYLAIWIISGEGYHVIDFEKVKIQPKTLIFVRPGQVQQWLIEKPVTGLYCAFDEEIFQIFGAYQFFKELTFLAPFANPGIHVADDLICANKIEFFFENMMSAFYATDWAHGIEVLAWLQILCIYAERAFERGKTIQKLTPSQQITSDFLHLADTHAMKNHNLSFYGNQLGITIGHLTETVKEVYGQSAGELLRTRLILEAKRLLAHTNLTISEIAQHLNYSDPSYFSRAFKREVGQTPGSFRQEFQRV